MMKFFHNWTKQRRSHSRAVPAKVVVLNYAALYEKLQEFEDDYARETGERLNSATFHDLYSAGDLEEYPQAFAWAAYYEIFREYGHRSAEEAPEQDLKVALA